jgi:hypothetical protein
MQVDVSGKGVNVSIIRKAVTDEIVLVVHGDHLCTIRHVGAPKRLAATFTLIESLPAHWHSYDRRVVYQDA